MDRKELEQLFNSLLNTHAVSDFVSDATRFVFVLESPHIEEIKCNMPVSGSSGRSMSSFLFDNELLLPLGVLVKRNAVNNMGVPLLDKIGLVNVCNIPMQKTAYMHPTVWEIRGPVKVSNDEQFFTYLERVRTNHTTLYATPECNILQDIILGHFKDRMSKLVNRDLVIVPCGRFAQKFFDMLTLQGVNSDRWKVVQNIPHPSYNNWSKPVYADYMGELKKVLNNEDN